jgi:hypothetical protein
MARRIAVGEPANPAEEKVFGIWRNIYPRNISSICGEQRDTVGNLDVDEEILRKVAGPDVAALLLRDPDSYPEKRHPDAIQMLSVCLRTWKI